MTPDDIINEELENEEEEEEQEEEVNIIDLNNYGMKPYSWRYEGEGGGGGGGGGSMNVLVVHVGADPEGLSPFAMITQETAGEIEEAVTGGNAVIIALDTAGDTSTSVTSLVCTFSKNPEDIHLYCLAFTAMGSEILMYADNSDEQLKFPYGE